MRQLILFGLLAMAGLTIAGCGGVLLLAALLFSASGPSSYSAGYDPVFDPIQTYPTDNFQPIGSSPVDQWPGNGQWSGSISHGTVDHSGHGNHVISVGGEVQTLPY